MLEGEQEVDRNPIASLEARSFVGPCLNRSPSNLDSKASDVHRDLQLLLHAQVL